jgi:hypothetical protein
MVNRSPGWARGSTRGNSSLELEPPQPSLRVRGPQVLVRMADQALVPQQGILVGERDETPALVSPRRCACRRELDQSREPPGLRVAGTEHRVERQGRAHGAVDRRVHAHEHQFKPPVRDRVDVNLIDMRQCVAEPVAGHGQQPRVGVSRYPLRRPRPQCPPECAGERVLRRGEVTRGGRQQGEQPAVAVPGRHAR